MQRNRRKSIEEQSAGGLAGQLLGLSLFIMLLAFFIVLNSISSFDEAKVQPLTGSLEEAFATKIDPSQSLGPALHKSDAMGFGEGKTLTQVDGLFKAELTNVETITSSQQGVMYMRLPRVGFENMLAAIAKGEKPRFLVTLASLLRSDQRPVTYQMEILYNLSDNPARLANRQPQELKTAIQSVSAAAEKIEAAGLPARQIRVGLQQGNTEFVELLFRPVTTGAMP